MPQWTKRNFTGGEIDPALHGRADVDKFQTGLKTLTNFIIQKQGGVTRRGGTKYIDEVKDSSDTIRLIPFEFNKDQAYILEFGDLYMRVYKDDGIVLETAQTITNITQADPAVVTVTGHPYSNGEEVFIDSVVGMTEVNGNRYTIANAGVNTFELTDIDGVDIDSSAFTAYSSAGTAARLFTLTTPYADTDLALLKYTQSADVMTLSHPSYAQRNLTRTDHDAWTITSISYSPTISAPTGVSTAAGGNGGGDHARTYEYVVTAVAENGEESLQSASDSVSTASLDGTHYVEVTWSAVTDADYYNIYKAESEVSDIYGFIGESKTTSFRDYNLAPDISDTPAEDRNPFNGSDDYPGTVTYYQQRQVFGRTNNNIQTLFASQSGNFTSFRISRPTKDDDAIERTIASETVNEIRHFVDVDALLVLTSGGVWRVTEGDDGVLTPASIGFRRQTSYGSAHTRPVTIGGSAIFAQLGGRRLRDLAYSFQSDAFAGNDLSILAEHLFEDRTIKEMAYQQEPDSVVWVVMSDGDLLGMTYQREHEIWGWHKHDTTNGTFESVAVIPEGAQDAVYFVVNRTIDGATKKYVEKMTFRDYTDTEDAFFLDSGLIYDSTEATSISGLDHLEGETVTAVADGVVDAGLTVTDGAITLSQAASYVIVGLPYTSEMETLDLDLTQSQTDSLRGNKINVGELLVKLRNYAGGKAGPTSSKLDALKARDLDDDYGAVSLKSREVEFYLDNEWQQNGHIIIQQTQPKPMTVLLIAPVYDVG